MVRGRVLLTRVVVLPFMHAPVVRPRPLFEFPPPKARRAVVAGSICGTHQYQNGYVWWPAAAFLVVYLL